MTQAHYAPTSLELEAQQLGAAYSRTSAEREEIAVMIDDLIQRYEGQGGRFALKWVTRHAGLSHATASSMRDAGYAIRKGAQRGQGVTTLATVGRQLRKGKTLAKAQHIATDLEARREATYAAGIGLGKVQYPSELGIEMANSYTALAQTLHAAGLPQQDVPEMTVTLTRLALQAMTPGNLQLVEAGGPLYHGHLPLPGEHVRSDFYSWLARQECARCGVPGCHIHHVHVGDLPNAPGGRRHHDHKDRELLIPYCPRCHALAHTMKQADIDLQWFGHPQGSVICAARYMNRWALETGVLRGEKA